MPGIAGVMKTVVDRSLDARRDTQENIFFDVDPLSLLSSQSARSMTDNVLPPMIQPHFFVSESAATKSSETAAPEYLSVSPNTNLL